MDYDKRKDEIITAFYKSGIIKNRIDSYYKGKLYINRDTKIAEEIMNQTWFELCNYPAQKLVERTDGTDEVKGNPKYIEQLASLILKYQLQHKKNGSPNNSFGTKLIYASNYFSDDYISPTDTYLEKNEAEEYKGIPIADIEDNNFFTERNYEPDRWEEIKKRLSNDEIEFVIALWHGEKFYKRKPTNAYKEYRLYILNKIEGMDFTKPLTKLEIIKTKLSMQDNIKFEIMFDENLEVKDKMKLLKLRSESAYFAHRRILLKKIKELNV